MKTVRPNRRQMLELCISRGMLLGATALSHSQLLVAWQKAEAAANKPTPAEVLGPFFRKGAPDNRILRAPGDAGFPFEGVGQSHGYREGSLSRGRKSTSGMLTTTAYTTREATATEPSSLPTAKACMPSIR